MRKFIHSLLLQTCAQRDYSAQEVCHIMNGQKLMSAGQRNFVYCNLSKSNDWEQIHDHEDTTQGKKGKTNLEKYLIRPPEFEDITLYEALRYRNLSTWSKKKKENIVRIFPKLRLGDDEGKNQAYYRQQVLLHSHWRNESDFESLGNWKQLHESLPTSHSDSLQVPNEIPSDDNEPDPYDKVEIRLREEWMIVSEFAPNRCVPTVELGLREADRTYNWLQDVAKYQCYGTLQDFHNFIKVQKQIAPSESITHFDLPQVDFSPEQLEVVTLMNAQINSLKSKNPAFSPRRVIIQGKARCGKSLVIKYLTTTLNQEFDKKNYLVLAPTGVAAVNVGGETLHSVLKLPRSRNQFDILNGEAAKAFCDKFEHIDFIIIDEFSMIGLAMLAMIDLRLRQAKGCNKPFGGLIIWLLGDIRQLPPVKDYPLYSRVAFGDLVQQGQAAFSSFEKVFVLKVSFRQQDKEFEDLLDRLSSGNTIIEDYNVLKSRFKTDNFQDANLQAEPINLFSTKEQVFSYNLDRLRALTDNELPAPVARISAKHNSRAAAKGTADDADGLSPIIYLAKGCKIMLRMNLWTQKGLVNGSIGTVVDILYNSEDTINNIPEVIMCKFENYTGPGIGPNNDIVPIPPVSKSWTNSNGDNCTRMTFPIVLCYALSIHKAQGLTLHKAQINIGEKEFALGLAYVALSRVKTLEGLVLSPFCFERLSRLKTLESMKQRLEFEKTLDQRQ